MSTKRIGAGTVQPAAPVFITSSASYVGPFEGEGPLREYFDVIIDDDAYGESSWEKAESRMVRDTFGKIITKSGKNVSDVNYVFSGDLLNQCVATSFGLADSSVAFFGLFGACSTMAESMSLGTMVIDGGFADNVVAMTSSHFCSAERQFRFPLELGSQRPPTAQWTVTGSGGVMLSNEGVLGSTPRVTALTTGKIVEMGIKDANNMGAAMAPSAADTIAIHLNDLGRAPSYYDLIVTGDLGSLGHSICIDLLNAEGFDLSKNYNDCGMMVYDPESQDVHAGGSGCGCSAVVLSGFLMNKMTTNVYNKILFVGTGALMSPTTTQQGLPILGISHAVSIEI